MQLGAVLATVPVIAPPADLRTEVHDVTRDSRQVAAGVIFVAIAGARVDGHDLVADLPAGSVAVVERAVPAPPGVALVQVADTRAALPWLAAAVHGEPATTLPVVGVTGTNGKTTVTTLLAGALEGLGWPVARIGTLGARALGRDLPGVLTTPEAPDLQRLLAQVRDAGGRAVAMEVSSIGLVQHRVDALPFSLAVFTNLGRDHLDVHGTMEAYVAAKALLFDEAHLRPAGGPVRALVQADDHAWQGLHAPPDTWRYGRSAGLDVCVEDLVLAPEGTSLTVATPLGTARVRSPLVGEVNALNLTAALASAALLGAGIDEAAEALAAVGPPAGRLERFTTPGGPLVLVDYAHTPDALVVALEAARALASGRVHLVFGCGGDRDRGKRPLMGAVAAGADVVTVTNDNPRSEDPEAIAVQVLAGLPAGRARVQLDRAAAIAAAVAEAAPGDVVLVAGKGHETTQEQGGRLTPFDDRAQVRAALAARSGSPA